MSGGVLYSNLDANNQRILALPTPASPGEPVTMSYLETFLSGRPYKPYARVAVASNVNISSPGATLDGITMVAGDPVLLFGQSSAPQNGVYLWNGASTAMTRRTDMDIGAEFVPGTTFPVTEGTYADRFAIMTTDGTITVGTSPINFVVMSQSGIVYAAGNGLQKISDTFSILLDTNSGLLSTSTGLKVDYSVVPRKFAADIGNGSATTFLVNHNFGTRDVIPSLRKLSTQRYGDVDVYAEDTNNTRFTFSSAPTSAEFRVMLLG